MYSLLFLVVSVMCASIKRNKKKASNAFIPILTEVDNLGSMDPTEVREILVNKLTAKSRKDLKGEMDIVLRVLSSVQV